MITKEEIIGCRSLFELDELENKSPTDLDCFKCYWCTGCVDCDKCDYCTDCIDCNGCCFCVDCTNCLNSSNCNNSMSCYGCVLCRDCKQCVNCKNCTDCNNCILCEDLRGRQYMVKGIQLSPEEYTQLMTNLGLVNEFIKL